MSTTVPSLGKLQTRRAALAGELATAQAALEGARAALVDGSTSAAKVVSAQSLVSTLEGALDALDTTIGHVAALEATERALAQREAAKKHLVAVAADAERERARVIALTAKACKALEPLFDQMSTAVDAWAKARAAWVAGATDLAPALHKPFYEPPSWADPADLEAVERLMGELEARGDTSAARSRVFALSPQTTRDNPYPLDLPTDGDRLAVALFGLWKRWYHARNEQNRLDF